MASRIAALALAALLLAQPMAVEATTTRYLHGAVTWYCVPGRSACTHGYSPSLCRAPWWRCYAAAGPAVRSALGASWRGRTVTVYVHRARLSVRLIDWCSCPGNRLLDLYGSAFSRLAPLWVGVASATVGVIR